MKKIVLVLMLVAVLALAGPAAASPPEDVQIEVTLPGTPQGVGSFVAIGAAEESGVVCPTGTTQDLSFSVNSIKGGRGIIVNLLREYTCDDDANNTFIMRVNARILFVPEREVSGRWNILSGTGTYENLHGSGALTDSELQTEVSLSVIDILDGIMHSD